MKRICLFVLSVFYIQSAFSQRSSEQQVKLIEGKFSLNNDVFFPMVLNYQIDLYSIDGKTLFAGPHHGYSKDNNRCCSNETDALMALFSDFARIKEMGFNCIRICGLEMEALKQTANKNLYYLVKKGDNIENAKWNYTKTSGKNLASILNKVINEAHEAGLKVILLTGKANLHRQKISDLYGEWLNLLSDSLKNNPGLFAYDLYNEPIYSSSVLTNKLEIERITESWYKCVRKNDKSVLITYGLNGHEDVMIWDPSVVKCDFLSFHLYPKPNDFGYVSASIKWFKNNIKKPWIIGETGYSSNDTARFYAAWGTNETQTKYAQFALKQAFCCGAVGFSWWVYRDVFWGSDQNWFGLIDQKGTFKPSAEIFKSGISKIICDGCNQADDLHYYRTEDCSYTVKGLVEDEKGKPIPDAVIYGWNKKWEKHVYTFSDNWGNFVLCSSDEMKYVKVSALGKSTIHKIVSFEKDRVKNIGRIELNPYFISK